MPAYTIKLCVLGNVEVGKSKFCNLFTNTKSKTSYEPTVGCRIIEYDTNINGISTDNQHSEQFEVTLEFWDISGDLKYKNGWTAIKKDCHGAIIIYDSSKMQESDVRMWHNNFVNKSLSSKQCLILSMLDDNASMDTFPKLKRVSVLQCELEENKNDKLSSKTMDAIMDWVGVVFGHHPDAEFGVFDWSLFLIFSYLIPSALS